MASPVDAGRVATAFTAVTPWVIGLPAGIVAGDLIILLLRTGGTAQPASHPTPNGFTSLLVDSSDATDDSTFVYYKRADGTEGTSLSMNMNIAIKGAAVAWRITGAANPTTQAPQVSTVQVFTTTANAGNAPSISPTGGSKDYLFLTCIGLGGTALSTGVPAGYGNPVGTYSTGGSAATNAQVAGGSLQATIATHDAGAWTHGAATTGGCAFTVAIHPGFATQNVSPSGKTSAQSFGTVNASIVVPSAYRDRILALGPTLYLRLGETGATASDLSGNSLNGAHTSVTAGQPGGLAGDADLSVLYGASGAVTTIAPNTLHQTPSTWTIEAWIYRTGVPATEVAIVAHQYMPGNLPFGIFCSSTNGGVYAAFFNGAWQYSNVAPVAVPALNTWTHVVGTYDGTTLRCYVNGVLDSSAARSGWVAAPAGAPLLIGKRWDSAQSFPGRIDEVALYSRTLDGSTIKGNYLLGSELAPFSYSEQVVLDGPRAYWRLGADPTIDSSGNGFVLSPTTLLRGELLPALPGLTPTPLPGAPEPRSAPSVAPSLLNSDSADGSRDFNGAANQYYWCGGLTTSGATPVPPFTVEAWVNSDGGAATADIINKYQSWVLRVNAGKFEYDYLVGGTWGYVVSGAISFGTTYHVAVVHGTSTVSLYVNGVLAGSAASIGSPNVNGESFYIGTGDFIYDGRLDELALYPVALSAAQVLEHYTIGSAVPPSPQTVAVDGTWPNGFVPSITGEFLAGDGHVAGGSAAAQFGVPTVTVTIPAQNVQPAGLASAQAFGVPTITGAITKPAGGVSSAQAFGTPVIVRGAVSRAVGGVSSAQAFGTPLVKSVTAVPVTGVGSAQSFGLPTLKLWKQALGVPSAQQFGAVTPRPGYVLVLMFGVGSAKAFGAPTVTAGSIPPQTQAVSGVTSAQAFGVPLMQAAGKTSVGSVPSAGAFGTPTIVRGVVSRAVGGVASAQSFGTPTIRAAIVKPVGGVASAQAFTAPLAVPRTTVPVSGVPSARAFGTVATVISAGVAQNILVAGVPSAQALGKPSVQLLWLSPSDCLLLDLAPAGTVSATLTAGVCRNANPPLICGTFLCGEEILPDVFLSPSVTTAILHLDPMGAVTLDLELAEVT